MDESAESGTVRIHFMSDVQDFGNAYGCKRCGYLTMTKHEMYEHRAGILSECLRHRVKNVVTGTTVDWLEDSLWTRFIRNQNAHTQPSSPGVFGVETCPSCGYEGTPGTSLLIPVWESPEEALEPEDTSSAMPPPDHIGCQACATMLPYHEYASTSDEPVNR